MTETSTKKRKPIVDLDCSKLEDLTEEHLILMLTSRRAHRLESLSIRSTNLTDSIMPYITRLKNVRRLSLRALLGVSREALGTITQLSNLESLSLVNCALSPDLIERLATLPNLQSLELKYSFGLEDDGSLGDWLKYVAQMTNLRELRVDSFRLSGDNLLHLQHLRQLTYLKLSSRCRWEGGRSVPDKDVGGLQQAITLLQSANPVLEVEWGLPTSTTG